MEIFKKVSLKKFLTSEVVKYLIFGVLTTVVYMIVRVIFFSITNEATLSAFVANVAAVIFAFVTNDKFVFNQVRHGWWQRFMKFVIARLFTLVLDLALAYLLVEAFPHIIGQFVKDDIHLVNAIETIIGQVLIIVLNYVLSKLFVFKNTEKA